MSKRIVGEMTKGKKRKSREGNFIKFFFFYYQKNDISFSVPLPSVDAQKEKFC